MARKKHQNTGPHVAGCACGPCHNARTAELRAKAPKFAANPCPATDSDRDGLVRGRPCVLAAGHEGPHSTGGRTFVDAPPPPEPKARKAKAPKATSPAPGAGDADIGVAFLSEWRRLSRAGVCDAEGGAERQRVVAEWDAAGRPAIEPFIRGRANIGPGSLEGIAPEPSESSNIQTGRASGLEHPADRVLGYRRHAAGALWSFADLEGEDFDKLVTNLRERHDLGLPALINPIVLVTLTNEHGAEEALVLDGWNRARACEAAGVRAAWIEYEGPRDIDSLIAYVDAVNDKRRHTTPSQRAAVAAEAARLRQGNSKARTDGTAKTQAERAAEKGISTRLLRRAEKVQDNVTPKMWETVKRGKVTVDAAREAIGLPAAKQDELADRALAGKGEMRPGKFKSIARQEAKREVVQRVNCGLVPPMPAGRFGVIVVDYPWLYENSDNHEGSRGHMPYQGMPMPEILAHGAEAAKRAADDCVLGLWITNAFMPELAGVLAAWGFAHRTIITWDKVHVAMGSWPRGQTEHLVIASRGKPTHTLNEITTLVRLERETGHSKKPQAFYDLFMRHCAGPFLELFAIGPREGWETWGAEAERPIATPRKSKIITETDRRHGTGMLATTATA